MLDLIIIGAGPAGMSACLYASRAGLEVLILDGSAPGGKLNVTAQIENYPGLKPTPGPEIAFTMYESAMSFGAKMAYEEALDIKDHGDFKEVITAKQTYQTKYVLIATGTKERQMNLEKENELIDEIKYLEDRLKRSALLKINKEKLLLDSFVSNLTSPKQRLEEEKLKLDLRYNKLRELFEKKLSSKREKYIELVSGLNALNPLDVLSRGYAVAFTQDGKPIDSIDKAEDKIILRLNDGRLYLTLDRKEHINIEK